MKGWDRRGWLGALVCVLIALAGCSCGIGVVVCRTGQECSEARRCMDGRCQKPSKEGNRPPIARVVVGDQRVKKGGRVRLDGASSSDVDLDKLQFRWTFSKRPKGSKATLENAENAQASFVADVPGTFIVKLTVVDGFLAADEEEVMIRGNHPPEANAGGKQLVLSGATVTLKGDESQDADLEDTLAFAWSLLKKPGGSFVSLKDAKREQASFVADKPGLYLIQLEVSDGLDSSTTTTTVRVAEPKEIVPTLGSMEPNRAPRRSIVDVTLRGSNWIQGAKVLFDDKPLVVDYRSSERLLVQLDLTSAKLGERSIRVENPGGKRTRALAFRVDEVPKPLLTSLNPGSGTSGLKAKVSLSGNGFVVGARVFFRDKPVPTQYVNSRNLKATVSLAGVAPGSYDMFVENDKGKRSNSKTFKVVLIPPTPQIISERFSPVSLSRKIDVKYDFLRFYVRDLLPTAEVWINNKRYSGEVNVLLSNSTQRYGQVELPGFSTKGWKAGSYAFVVKNISEGQSTKSSPRRISFTSPYVPRVSSLRFWNGTRSLYSRASTEQVYERLEIRGSNFLSGAEVLVNDKVMSEGVRRKSSTLITISSFSTKGLAIGQHTIHVRNKRGKETYKSSPSFFALTDGKIPQISSVTSSDGTLYTGRDYTFLLIVGQNFAEGAQVIFDGVPHKGPVQRDSETQLYMYKFATHDLQVGTHTVVVRNTMGGKTYDSRVYRLALRDGKTLRIRSVSFSPSTQIYPNETYRVRMYVENALPNVQVVLDGQLYSGLVQFSRMQLILPQFSTAGLTIGTHTFQIRNRVQGQNYDSNVFAFVVRAPEPPLLMSLRPSWIGGKKPVSVVISGRSFRSSAKVSVGGQEYRPVSVSTRQVTVLLDPSRLASGLQKLKVVHSDGQSSNELDLGVASRIGPTLWQVSPNRISLTKGNATTPLPRFFQLYGFNLEPGAGVFIDGVLSGQIPLSANPGGSAVGVRLAGKILERNGILKVTVKNSDGQVSNATELFVRVFDKPEIYRVSPTFLSRSSRGQFLSILGRGFGPKSKILWNGNALATSYALASSSPYNAQLSAFLDRSRLASSPDASQLVVENEDGSKSAVENISISDSSSSFYVSSVSPSAIALQGQVQNLRIRGRGFSLRSVVMIGGKSVPTTYLGSSSLQVVFQAQKLSSWDFLHVQVKEGSRTSNSVPLHITQGSGVRQVSPPILLKDATGPQILVFSFSNNMAGATLELFGRSFPVFATTTQLSFAPGDFKLLAPGLYTFRLKFANGEYGPTGGIHLFTLATPPPPLPSP